MKWIYSILLVCFLCIPSAFAQTSKGFLVGTVADPDGAVIPNANITITNIATGVIRTTVSQGNGTYRFDAIDPGTYNLEITATGFTATRSENIVVNSAQTAEANLQLAVSGASATVNVTGTDSSVNYRQPTEHASTRSSSARLPNFPLPVSIRLI